MMLVPALFGVGMFLAYWMKLPYLYQNGRYIMPILPMVILLGLGGVGTVLSLLRKSVLRDELALKRVETALWVIFVGSFTYGSWQSRPFYQDYCKYISDRQVRTARWMHDNLPEDAVVGTHDVGAIAYYSGRKIVDMVGLIDPEMIQNIGNIDKMKEFLVRGKVTHLALLRNWFEVVNVNPLFQTNEQTPEIMEVFEFDPSLMHMTSTEVSWLTARGWEFLIRGDARQGGPLVEQAVQRDSLSSRAHHHFGWALMMVGEFGRSEAELRKAIALHPSYWSAYFALAQVPLRQGKTADGVSRLEKLLSMYPRMLPAAQQLAQIHEHQGDTAKAQYYMEVYNKGLELDAKKE
jgi:Tfp pilus assembly protein PilF